VTDDIYFSIIRNTAPGRLLDVAEQHQITAGGGRGVHDLMRVSLGDVFTIPVDERRVGYAQAVSGNRLSFFFAVFTRVDPIGARPDIDALVAAVPTFLVETTINKINEGSWVKVGRGPVAADMPFPAFLIPRQGEVFVGDHFGTRVRLATPSERDQLSNRFSVSPVRLEKALRAELGLDPWQEDFDRLRPGPGPDRGHGSRDHRPIGRPGSLRGGHHDVVAATGRGSYLPVGSRLRFAS
jgi:hypothetical protein